MITSIHCGESFIYDSLFKPHNNFSESVVIPFVPNKQPSFRDTASQGKRNKQNLVNISKTPDVE